MNKNDQRADAHPSGRSLQSKIKIRLSVWVILGFTFWIGFLIGAIIMHAAAR
jgi:hypothetical protein